MSKENNLTDFIVDVADAIREKKGSSEKINPQNFSEEIKNLPSGASPFAVDFGEEIATGNPAYMGALQEDIDYYNQIQEERRLYAEGKGGRSDVVIRQDSEFRKRIAWWPNGMEAPVNDLGKTRNLKESPKDVLINTGTSFYNSMPNSFVPLDIIDWDFSEITNRFGHFLLRGIVGNVNLYLPSVTSLTEFLRNMITGPHVKVSLPNYTGEVKSVLLTCAGTEVFEFYAPKATNIQSTGRTDANDLKEIYADISSAKSGSYAFYNNSSLRVAHIKGLMFSVNITQLSLQLESVKYILDHCQAREDGAAYTLTLNATVKQNFMNKCTEGHEEYDAEYAASLASANSKGLTLA